jgi:hypothetical protein
MLYDSPDSIWETEVEARDRVKILIKEEFGDNYDDELDEIAVYVYKCEFGEIDSWVTAEEFLGGTLI